MTLGKSDEPFDYVETDTNEVATIRYLGTKQNVKVPAQINGEAVKEVYPFTFTDRTDITSVVIPNGVEELD